MTPSSPAGGWRLPLALTLLVCLACAWPLRAALVTGDIPGAGPDVVSTLWGMWWLQQTGPSALLGTHSALANAPEGAIGSVLSPIGAISWALTEPLLGAGGAGSVVALEQTAGFALAVGLLAAALGLGRAGVVAASLSCLVGRPLFFALGEGSAVAIAAIPLPLGLAAMLAPAQGRRLWVLALALAACMAGVAAENPYLAPVLPGVAALRLLLLLRRKDMELALPLGAAIVLGSVGILLVAGVFGRSADPNYPGEIANRTVMLGPLRLLVVDMPWARALPDQLLWPGPVRWTLDVEGGALAGGGRYLGLSVLGLAGLSLALDRRAAAPWFALGLVGLLVSMGSLLPGGAGGPFLYLNSLMDKVARPLTQPTRFLLVAQLALAVGVALAVAKLSPLRQRLALGVLLLDALLFGGLSLRLPTAQVPGGVCIPAFFEDHSGPVLVWPWDAADTDASPSQLYQLAHGQPSPHRGIASWRLPGPPVLIQLRGLGWRVHGPDAPMEVNWTALNQLGFSWVIVEQNPEDPRPAELERTLGEPAANCGAQRIYALPSGRSPP